MKYKQTIIPSVKSSYSENNSAFIKKFYAENLQGKKVKNKHLGIDIYFTNKGKSELAHGRATYKKKVAVMKGLLKILEVAEYNNFGQRKSTDKQNVLGYYNFKAKVNIDDKIENVRISILITTDLKAYYNHEVNIIK